jgi:hypothetical protein
MPSFLTYNGDANPTPTSSSAHHIEWNNLAPLAVGDSITITFSAHADSAGESDNVASIVAKYDCEPEVTDSDTARVEVTCGGDDEPPVTTKEYGRPFYTDGTNDWITSNTLVWLNATDYPLNNPSGVKHTYYRISKWDGSNWVVEVDWTIYTCPFTIPSECHHKIEFYSIDNACNQEEIKWQTVYVDNTPPCSSLKVTDDPDRYVCRVSTVTITSNDGGICPVGSYTLYCYINGELYAEAHNRGISFQFNEMHGFREDGRYVVEYWAVDDLGNEETHHSEAFILDTTPPDTEYSFDGPHRWADTHWQIEPTTKIVLTATDSGSGVEYTKYRIGYQDEGGTWQTYTGPFIPTKENIFFFSRDKVGNQESGHHLYVEIVDLIENQPPETPERPSGPTSGKINVEYTYTARTVDPDGDEIYYLFDWGDGTNSGWLGPYNSGETISVSHRWEELGNYQIRVKAKDVFGEESDWSDPLPISMPLPLLSPSNTPANNKLIHIGKYQSFSFITINRYLNTLIINLKLQNDETKAIRKALS